MLYGIIQSDPPVFSLSYLFLVNILDEFLKTFLIYFPRSHIFWLINKIKLTHNITYYELTDQIKLAKDQMRIIYDIFYLILKTTIK